MIDTKIQWCDATINFWTGCTKVSDGCKYCYMYRDMDRYGKDATQIVEVSLKTISKTLKDLEARRVENEAAGDYRRLRIFTCSWSDFFIEDADDFRGFAWQVIKDFPQFDWLVLTKRIDRVQQCLPDDWGKGYRNVWLGVSIENQKYVKRAELLCETPAYVRFISAEPLLEHVNLTPIYQSYYRGINWIIIGGESGNDTGKWLYRDAQEADMLHMVQEASHHGVAVFVKQMGTAIAKRRGYKDRNGGVMSEWVVSGLQVRQFPGDLIRTEKTKFL